MGRWDLMLVRGGAGGPGWGVYGRMRRQQLEQAGASGAPPSPLLRSPKQPGLSQQIFPPPLMLQKYVQYASIKCKFHMNPYTQYSLL